jgi:general secretion pathway protein D
MQVIPIKFGIKGALERTIRSLSGAKIVPDFEQSAIFATGSRSQILKTIELINLLDTPATRGRYLGLVQLTYMLPDQFVKEVKVLLGNEGISAAVRDAKGANLVLVPLEQLGATVVFSTNEAFLDRVRYWASVLDAPLVGDSKQYFIYKPKYSRAKDISESIGKLIGSSSSASVASGGESGQAPDAARRSAGVVDGVDMVIDERANALIFYSSGIDYRALLPLVKRLDVMPKQVMLDIVIAEVSLKDEFRYGVEWAMQQSEVILTTQGAFGATSLGGMGLLIEGALGPLQANFLGTNSLVKVLSNPSLMVRDGTKASISIGSEISVVGQTTQDPINGDRQTTSSEYRSTGVDVSVDVAINATGIVVLTIAQSISNTVPGSAGAGGNPDIFTRDVKTEVLARSGQTVMLGGLISESSSVGGSGTPILSKIPLLGGLFKAESKGSDRTELVMLVTPKVVEDLSGWEELMQGFSNSLNYLQFNTDSE